MPEQQVRMTCQGFGIRRQREICAQAEGILPEDGGRGVVHGHQRAVAVGCLAQPGDIAHIQIRVAGGLDEKQARPGQRLELGVIGGWRQADLHAHLRQVIAGEDARGEVGVAWQRQDVSRAQGRPKNGGDGCHTGSKADRRVRLPSSARALSNAVQVGLWLRP